MVVFLKLEPVKTKYFAQGERKLWMAWVDARLSLTRTWVAGT